MTTTPIRPQGLDDHEVADREARGLVNDITVRPSRTVGAIVRANVFTRFNAILGVLLAVVLVVGPLQDALFAGVLVSNALIGIIQEVRAKRTLDRLALLTAPRAMVVRGGRTHEIDVARIVADDVIEARAGDQVVADGVVIATEGLEVDESLLTGESDPEHKRAGDQVLSGSFFVAGSGHYRVTKVGREAYAVQLAEQARRFTLVRSELRSGIDRILQGVQWLLVPTAVLLLISQLTNHASLGDALRASVAGIIAMIPEGLVLLTSVAFAVGVVRLGRRRVLVQELPAIEGLARVDVVCVDKTGTLTDGHMAVADVDVLDPTAPVVPALAALAACDPHPNASLRAIDEALPPPEGWVAEATVPFSSARKWAAAAFAGHGTWVLGAPDVVLAGVVATNGSTRAGGAGDAGGVRARVEGHAGQGRRVLLLARSGGGLGGERLPDHLEPAALVVLDERIREDAADTLAYFASQGVALKVISGDHPRTVGAVASRLGLAGADHPMDARHLPDDPDALADVMEATSVFGRVTPHQKRAMVGALQARGHVVAMTGDGVNDVLALKDADLGVAMGAGSAATRSVAQLVLLDNTFASLPPVLGEGRRVTGNVERVANLFVTKTVYAMLLALAVGVAGVPFPFLPRHLTIISSLTIGVPGFVLALAPNTARAQPGFVGRVLRFAIPCGVVAAAATFSAYALARSEDGVSLISARTTATIVLFTIGLWVLSILARPIDALRAALLAGSVGAFLLILAIPATRTFFELELPPIVVLLAAVGTIALAGVALEVGWRASGWVRQHGWVPPLGHHDQPATRP